MQILVPTIVSASVAVIFFSLTQILLRHYHRIDLLSAKYELIYFHLLKMSDQHTERCKTLRCNIKSGEIDQIQIPEIYGLDDTEKLQMYIDMYFPCIKKEYLQWYGFNNEFLEKIHTLAQGGSFSINTLEYYLVNFGRSLQYLKRTIISNRKLLTHDYCIRKPRKEKICMEPQES